MMFTDEKGIHFDVEKFWDNDVFTVLQRWEDKVGDEEVDRAIKNVVVRWKEYVNKAGNDTALKIINHICGETVSKDEQTGGLLRQLLFVEIKGGKLESFLDGVVLEIQEEEQRRAGELEGLRREPAPEEPATETQAPEADGEPPAFLNNKTVSTKDPVKVTLNWLRNRDRQYIKRHTEPDRPVMANGAIDYIEPTKSEWRITKPAAHIYRELCKAAETGEILLAKAAVPDFMINNLRRKDGDDITKDSLTHADKRPKTDKRRQKPTK